MRNNRRGRARLGAWKGVAHAKRVSWPRSSVDSSRSRSTPESASEWLSEGPATTRLS